MASELPLVIVGAGIAGVCAALAAAPRPVLLLSCGGDGGDRVAAVAGVRFDRDGEQLQLGREGGHGLARVVHAGGDRSGASATAAGRAYLLLASDCRSMRIP